MKAAALTLCLFVIGCSGIEMRECVVVYAVAQPESCAARGEIRWGWDSTPRPGDGAATRRAPVGRHGD